MDIDVDVGLKLESLKQCLSTVHMLLILYVAPRQSNSVKHRSFVTFKDAPHHSYRAAEIAAVNVVAT